MAATKDYFPAGSDGTSSPTNGDTIESFTKVKSSISLQIVTTGFNQADATVKAQESNDGTNWVDVTGASITLASGSASKFLTLTSITARYNRFVFTKGTNSAGTYKGVIHYR